MFRKTPGKVGAHRSSHTTTLTISTWAASWASGCIWTRVFNSYRRTYFSMSWSNLFLSPADLLRMLFCSNKFNPTRKTLLFVLNLPTLWNSSCAMNTHPKFSYYGTSTHFLHAQLILKTSPPTLVIFPLPAFHVRDRKMVCAKQPNGTPCCITNPEIQHIYEFMILVIKCHSK